MKPRLPLRAALDDPDLFGRVLAGESWRNWRILLVAAMGEPLHDDERAIFRELTGGREHEPGERVEELWAIIGRRGGKTRAVAVLAAYIASLVDFSDVLAPGERASLPIVSATVWQAQKCFQYLDGIFHSVPALNKLVTNQTSDTISLSTRVDIECRPSNFRHLRGGTCCAVIADEVAFWRSETSTNPDAEILTAARPSLATTGGMLAVITSPYARRGEVWATFKRDYGPDADKAILVARAASQAMNPTLPEKTVTRAYERDAASASAEYGAEFRSDLETFISREIVDACIIRNRIELPPARSVSYFAFCDPSGGSSDDMTLSVAHLEDETVIIDAIRAVRPPFSPDSVVTQFCDLLKSYRVDRVTGDRYGGQWPRERFDAHGVRYEPAEKPKSDLYAELLPLLNARRIELPDDTKLISQLCNLERRTARGGRDSIDHPTGQHYHDDLVNAVAGAAALAMKPAPRLICQTLIGHFATSNPNYRPSPPRVIEAYPPAGVTGHVLRNY